jgi:hypothetical protein
MERKRLHRMGSANRPVVIPARNPATAWVWKAPRVSSILYMKDHLLGRTIIVYQGILPERIPITIGAQPCTRPVEEKI